MSHVVQLLLRGAYCGRRHCRQHAQLPRVHADAPQAKIVVLLSGRAGRLRPRLPGHCLHDLVAESRQIFQLNLLHTKSLTC